MTIPRPARPPGHITRTRHDLNDDRSRDREASHQSLNYDYLESARARRLQAWYDRRTAHWGRVVERIVSHPRLIVPGGSLPIAAE